MKPQLLARPELTIIGIETRTINRAEMAPSTAKIPVLWRRFFDERIAEKIPNKKPQGPVMAAYAKYESDHTGPYSLVIGLEVNSLESIPSGMTGLTIPGGQFLVFTAQGPMPNALIETWTSVWNHFREGTSHRRLYTADYEIHRGDDRVDVYIAVDNRSAVDGMQV